MTVLLQISDLHFGTEQAPVMDALHRMVRAERPNVLVVSGDITQRATPTQFAAARAFCDKLGVPQMLALPGNHDIPLCNVLQRVFSPYRNYLRAFGPSLEGRLETPEIRVISVKTTRRWRHKNGELSSAQIDRVVKELQHSPAKQLRLVVVHQPVHVMRAEDEHDRLRGAEKAVSAWAAAGADIVMGGHIHLPYVCELVPSPNSPQRRMWCVQAGTALSSRVRWEAPNSVNLLRYEALSDLPGAVPHCRLERWDYLVEVGSFALVRTRVLGLDRPSGAAVS